jgi:hypothetical protein
MGDDKTSAGRGDESTTGFSSQKTPVVIFGKFVSVSGRGNKFKESTPGRIGLERKNWLYTVKRSFS